jgi:DNA polymerase V
VPSRRAPATDLNALLIRDPARTLLLRVCGESMAGAGIRHGDLLVVDLGLPPEPGHIVVARIGDGFTLKRLVRHRGRRWLEAAHPAYPTLPLDPPPEGSSADLIGVAVHVIRAL